jgi:RNA polymerase sigma-70 factor (ECF subfamily)
MHDGGFESVLNSEAEAAESDSSAAAAADGAGSTVSDERLMVAYSRGTPEAFNELFRRYRQPIFGFFRRRVAETEQAEELAQDTFLALIRSATNYRPSATFRTYLYAIAFNVLRAHRRKATFRAMFSGSKEDEPSVRSGLDEEIVLRDALKRLDRVDREILLLREFEQLSYAEISELAQLPLNTVRSRLFRARMALREMLTAPVLAREPKNLVESKERI